MESLTRFDDTAKEEVRARIDIATVVGRYVNLKQSGQTLKGLCPFHKEKSPSFHVNPSRGFFHCFGCGKGGDVFSFIQEIEGIGFSEALGRLADETGVTIAQSRETIPHDNDEHVSGEVLSKGEMQRIHDVAALYYYSQIKQTPTAIEYFKTRGLKAETVRDFKLGFAPAGWSGLINHCCKQGISASMLVTCGLAIQKENGNAYDRFRDRIMFPLFDLAGKIIGLAGRGMSDEVQPKYLNSPETLLYRKNRFLYGLDRARVPIRENGQILIVEGYMDYLALYQAGIRNVAASSGTALTPEHGQLISRFTSKVMLTFDGDAAGVKAAERGVFVLAPYNLDVTILVLPGDEDPDSYIKKYGADSFLDQMKNAKNATDFIIEKLVAEHGTSPRGKATIIDQLLPLVQAMTNPIARAEFKKELADRLGVEQRLVFERISENHHLQEYSAASSQEHRKDGSNGNMLEESFLRILLTKPDLITMARQYISPETITDTASANIYSLLVATYEEKGSLDSVLDRTEDPEVKRLISQMLVKPTLLEHIQEELVQKIIHLRVKFLRARIREIKFQMKKEPQQRMELLQLLKECSMQLKELDERE